MNRILMRSASAGALVAACASFPAVAQTAAASPSPIVTADAGANSGDIVVTARRRDEQIQKVPLSITALSEKAIRSQGIVAPVDLMNKVPGLQISSLGPTSNTASYAIRGLGQTFGALPAVTTYFAEVPRAIPGAGYYFDLENIQVLKGPQGTLFGRNSTGGAVLVTPRKPGNDLGASMTLSAGNYGFRRVDGAVNVPIIDDKLAIRVAADIYHRDGYTRELTRGIDLDDRNYQAVRVGVMFRPSSKIENYLLFDTVRINQNGAALVPLNVRPGGVAGAVYPAVFGLLAQQQARGVRKVASDVDVFYERQTTTGLTNTTTIDLADSLRLKNIASYQTLDGRGTREADGFPLPIINYNSFPGYHQSSASTLPTSKTYTEELQLQGKSFDGSLDWIGGLFYEKTEPKGNPYFIGDRYQLLATRQFYFYALRTDSSRAAFAQATLDTSKWLLSGLSFTAGIRYTKDSRGLQGGSVVGAPVDPVTTFADRRAKFRATTWTLGGQYQITPDTMTYVTARRGYKSGGFNPDIRLPTYNPEFNNDIEVGLKTKVGFDGGTLRANAALYQSRYSAIQFTQIVTLPDGSVLTPILNAGRAKIKGAELDATLATDVGFSLSGYYALTDAKYKRGALSGRNLAGQRFEKTPLNKFSVRGAYDLRLPNESGDIELSSTYSWQSKTFLNLDSLTDPTNNVKAYGLVNLRADWNHFMGRPVTVSVFVTNLTNKAYQIFHLGTYNSLGYSAGTFNEPRMYGGQIHFDL